MCRAGCERAAAAPVCCGLRPHCGQSWAAADAARSDGRRAETNSRRGARYIVLLRALGPTQDKKCASLWSGSLRHAAAWIPAAEPLLIEAQEVMLKCRRAAPRG